MSKPEKVFRCGLVSASVWAQTRTIGGDAVTFHCIKIEKSYTEGNDWKHTNVFQVEDLPRLALVASEAYRYTSLLPRVPDEQT